MVLTVKLLIGAVIATIIGLVTMKIVDPMVNNNNNGVDISTLSVKNKLKVEITGQVEHAGNYLVEKGKNLEDVISIAGGITNNADEKCYFLDYEIESSESIYIAPLYDRLDVCSSEMLTKYNINNCKAEDLAKITGIGETTATSIVEYRENYGSYKKLEDVMNINGIKNATFSKLKNHIKLKD